MTRKHYSEAVKARVALEAITGQKTVAEITSEYKTRPQATECSKQTQLLRMTFLAIQNN